MKVDLNADLGEGCGSDEILMRLVTSANIACGAHAGGSQHITEALCQAKLLDLRVGAHPGYFDRENFGRLQKVITPEELNHTILYQLGALQSLAIHFGVEVSYIKAHGAMYHQTAHDPALGGIIIGAAQTFGLAIMSLPGSALELMAKTEGVLFIREGFADRRYRPDGTLISRTEANAMIHDPEEAARQVRWLIDEVKVDSICVHGDEPEAVEFTKKLRKLLLNSGVTLAAR